MTTKKRRLTRERITSLLDVTGLACIAAGVYALSLAFGLLVTGACLLVVSWRVTRRGRRR